MSLITNPIEIEKRSFAIISEKLAGRALAPQYENVIKRVIHTTADFDYADNLVFSEGVMGIAKEALQKGARIVSDTNMVKSGINKKAALELGCDVFCFIDAPEVAAAAQKSGFTRSREAVDRAAETLENPMIFVVGNAPTALIRLYELITSRSLAPALVIAAPVGFVNVVEAKELMMELEVPYIVAKGQKGGSNVAAAICNALLYETTGRVL